MQVWSYGLEIAKSLFQNIVYDCCIELHLVSAIPDLLEGLRDCDDIYPIPSLDKSAVLGQLEQLALLPRDWIGYGADPIDSKVIEAASRFIDLLPSDAISTPQVVPMTRGRLQFEWHRGNRSLELEFETPALIHYLKYDPDREIEEESKTPAGRPRL